MYGSEKVNLLLITDIKHDYSDYSGERVSALLSMSQY